MSGEPHLSDENVLNLIGFLRQISAPLDKTSNDYQMIMNWVAHLEKRLKDKISELAWQLYQREHGLLPPAEEKAEIKEV